MEPTEEDFQILKKKCSVIVAGGRNITSSEVVSSAIQQSNFLEAMTELVHGNCRGVDKTADKYFEDNYPLINRISFPANWNKYGKPAGMIRNKEMAKYAAESQGKLIIIWDGLSRGSKNMKQTAENAGLEIYEHIVE